ncbi:MAG: hypothetical protein ACYDCI_00295 [Candidatus Limnocylindrales bacterium]
MDTNTSAQPGACAASGHTWIRATGGSPARFVCKHCPAVGGDCPERGGSADGCSRCRGSGVVELVEIAAAEVADLRRDRRRLDWIACVNEQEEGTPRRVFLREIDELIAAGIGPAMRPGDVARRAQKKDRRPSGKRNGGQYDPQRQAGGETRSGV